MSKHHQNHCALFYAGLSLFFFRARLSSPDLDFQDNRSGRVPNWFRSTKLVVNNGENSSPLDALWFFWTFEGSVYIIKALICLLLSWLTIVRLKVLNKNNSKFEIAVVQKLKKKLLNIPFAYQEHKMGTIQKNQVICVILNYSWL